MRCYLLLPQALKAQEAALSDSEDKDDMDIADGGGKAREFVFLLSFKVLHACFRVPLCQVVTASSLCLDTADCQICDVLKSYDRDEKQQQMLSDNSFSVVYACSCLCCFFFFHELTNSDCRFLLQCSREPLRSS